MKSKLFRRGWVLLISFLVFACAEKEVLLTPEVTFLKAKIDYDKSLFENANTNFEILINNYPETKYAGYSYILIANSQFEKGVDGLIAGKALDEALKNYQLYVKLNPQSPLIPYAIYHMMFINHITNVRGFFTVGTNPGVLESINDDYKRFYLTYPKNVYFDESKYLLKDSLNKLAGYEERVGDWYYDQDLFNASISRYTYILTNYPGYPEIKRVAKKLISSYNSNDQPYLAEEIESTYLEVFGD